MKIPLERKYLDRPLWILFAILLVVAVISLFSAGSTLAYADDSSIGPIAKQILFLVAGVILAALVQYVPTWVVRFGGYIVLAAAIGCLYLMLIPNNPFVVRANEAGRWFNLFGIVQFQPSELAKLGLVIVVADLLARIKNPEDEKKYFFVTLGLTGLTCLPIFFGNLSTVVLMMGIIILMWFLARVSWKYILSVIGVLIVGVVLGYCIVEFGYVRQNRRIDSGPLKRAMVWVDRVDNMFGEMSDDFDIKTALDDEHYQRTIAKVAVARGGRSPFGVLPGNSIERDYLPLAYMDYIFAVIVEETGIVGAALLIFLYLAVLFRACLISNRYSDYSAMLMVMGLALMLTCQALISMAVSVGLGPVTGQPLPLISKGGTSVLITSLYFGIMMGVAREQKELREHQQMVKNDSYNDAPTITLEPN